MRTLLVLICGILLTLALGCVIPNWTDWPSGDAGDGGLELRCPDGSPLTLRSLKKGC